jgi:hypothetical protein
MSNATRNVELSTKEPSIMNEYKVKFQANAPGILGFPSRVEGFDVYQADTAKQAIEACERDFRQKAREYPLAAEDLDFKVLDVTRL